MNIKNLFKYFLNGLLFMVPLALTIFVFYFVFKRIDSLFIKVRIPGVGLFITVIVITFVGFLASNIVTEKYFGYIDKLFKKVPLVKLLYTSLKDLIDAFVQGKKKFNKPVIVSVTDGIRLLGFITSEGIESIGVAGDVAVYIPQSYNFAGNLFVVKREKVKILNTNSAKVMSLIVSAGLTGTRAHEKTVVEE